MPVPKKKEEDEELEPKTNEEEEEDEDDDSDEDEDDEDDDEEEGEGEATPDDVAERVAEALMASDGECSAAVADGKKVLVDLQDGSKWVLMVRSRG